MRQANSYQSNGYDQESNDGIQRHENIVKTSNCRIKIAHRISNSQLLSMALSVKSVIIRSQWVLLHLQTSNFKFVPSAVSVAVFVKESKACDCFVRGGEV